MRRGDGVRGHRISHLDDLRPLHPYLDKLVEAEITRAFLEAGGVRGFLDLVISHLSPLLVVEDDHGVVRVVPKSGAGSVGTLIAALARKRPRLFAT